MTLGHHSGGGTSDELRKLFDDEASARKRFSDQVAGRAKRNWPEGRVGPDDDGALAMAIGPHPEKDDLLLIDFGRPVEWLAMPPQHAVELAQMLIKQARAISKEPITIQLH